MNEIDTSARTHARREDPATSKAAAGMLKFTTGMGKKIHDELVKGDGTYEELAVRCGLRPDQVWRRMPDLQKAGMAVTTGEERPGSSGRNQRVWSAA